MKGLRCLLPCFAAALLFGCAPQSGSGDDLAASTEGEIVQPSANETPPIPDSFDRTAWHVEGDNGTRYVTFFDPGGRYRDWRDGEPWQEGAWDRREDGSICFLPDGTESQRRCWQPDHMSDADRMVVIGGEEGARVELIRADYIAPPETEDEDSGAEGT